MAEVAHPRVSVVIPCYNHGDYLDEAVSSVLAQTLTDVEIIVVNDGSTEPTTLNLLSTFSRPRTRVFSTPHSGVAAARNYGIARARGDFILPLDADDRIMPEYLEQAAAVLERHSAVGIVYCRAKFFGELQGEWLMPDFSLPHMLLDNLIFSAALFRRDDWRKTGGYSERMRWGWEDWDFWLKLLGLGREVVRLPEFLFVYRIRYGSRERSLTLARRFLIMAGLFVGHIRLYMRHAPNLLHILATGDRHRPARMTLPVK